LDMTLYDCGLSLLHPQAANFFLNGKRPAGTGNPHPNLVPYDKYPTRTCEIFIASGNNGQFRKLCELIGRPELADDPRFANNGERNVNRAVLTEADWYRGIGTPIKFSRTKGGTRRPPPKFAEHGTEVLSQLGYTEAEIAALERSGVV